jgi:hypothetical protein
VTRFQSNSVVPPMQNGTPCGVQAAQLRLKRFGVQREK